MSVKIEIDESDFERLKALAEPFVDTPGTVIKRILDQYGGEEVTKTKTREAEDLPGLSFEMPPLTHTKLLSAKFNGRSPDRLTWDALLRLSLEEASKKAKSFEELRIAAGANMVEGIKSDQGYKYLKELGISYQGVSAEDAAKVISRLTEFLWTECEFQLEWRNKPEAFMPGKKAFGHIGAGLLKVTWNSPHADH